MFLAVVHGQMFFGRWPRSNIVWGTGALCCGLACQSTDEILFISFQELAGGQPFIDLLVWTVGGLEARLSALIAKYNNDNLISKLFIESFITTVSLVNYLLGVLQQLSDY